MLALGFQRVQGGRESEECVGSAACETENEANSGMRVPLVRVTYWIRLFCVVQAFMFPTNYIGSTTRNPVEAAHEFAAAQKDGQVAA